MGSARRASPRRPAPAPPWPRSVAGADGRPDGVEVGEVGRGHPDVRGGRCPDHDAMVLLDMIGTQRATATGAGEDDTRQSYDSRRAPLRRRDIPR